MRRLLLALLLLLAARQAFAQTTFPAAAGECSPDITVTGSGLTLTAAANSNFKACVAGNPKFSGKWYYTFVPSVVSGSGGIGISSGLKINGIPGGLDPATCTASQCNMNNNTIGPWDLLWYGGSHLVWGAYNTLLPTSTGTASSGVTAAIVVNLDTDPNQIWFTPNVAGTSGFGGGPLWNGDVNATPEVHGTGFILSTGQELATPVCLIPRGSPPTCGTGFPYGLPGQLQYPTAFIQNGDALTFNFGTNATLTTQIPSYAPWNTSGGEPPTPGPNHPMEVQVSNAPGWTSGTRAVGYRANAGPAWNGSAYTSGSNLCLFAVVTGGTTGSDASVFNTACNSGAPAATGGVPSGTWPGATTVTDGSVTWALLTRVDEISLSPAFAEVNASWATSTVYVNGQYVKNGGNLYRQSAGDVSPNTCTSASSGGGPTGTAFNGGITDNDCSWAYRGTVVYTSHNAQPGHQLCVNGVCDLQIFYDINFNLWWGGTGRPTYWAGHNGENDPLTMWDLQDSYGEGQDGCYHGASANNGAFALAIGICNNRSWLITVRPAPGDGFANNLTASTGPLGYGDSGKGVMLFSDTVPNGATNGTGPAVLADISGLHFQGMQIYSTNGAAFGGNGDNFNDGWIGHVNSTWFDGSILYAAGQHGVASTDARALADNSVFIYAGSSVPCYGIFHKFVGQDVNNTFIGPGSSLNCSAIIDLEQVGVAGAAPRYNNAIFGFQNPWTVGTGLTAIVTGNNNVTDVSASYVPFTFTFNTITYDTRQLTGTTVNSASASASFVNPTVGASLDLRVKNSSSALYGAGGTYTYTPFAIDFEPYPFNAPGNDILGQSRPATGSRYDVGAEQFLGGAGPASVLRLRWFGR